MRRREHGWFGLVTTVVLAVAATAAFTGCGTVSGSLKADAALTGALATPESTVPTAAVSDDASAVTTEATPRPAVDTEQQLALLAEDDALTLDEHPLTLPADLFRNVTLAQRAQQDTADMPEEEYDPWEPFNEKMFTFNRGVDRWVFKPAARAYMFVMPEPWQVLISNGFDNINFVPRLVNSLLQAKWGGAGRELARFLINSTAGIGGLFDPAKDFWGIQKSKEDFGQTLGVWGSGPGPYLVLPFMEPLTVRDGIGKFVDGFMDPLSYVLPFIWDRLGMKIGDALNERALNYDLFQGFEESVIDMYSAVRHGYLQRRQQLIRE
ncbi:MAG TPA: VacJ family lipoprotein [Methylomirabilota bacterium]|nr:VacJ family lipoprotein [Methylomirabilota bacterium]